MPKVWAPVTKPVRDGTQQRAKTVRHNAPRRPTQFSRRSVSIERPRKGRAARYRTPTRRGSPRPLSEFSWDTGTRHPHTHSLGFQPESFLPRETIQPSCGSEGASHPTLPGPAPGAHEALLGLPRSLLPTRPGRSETRLLSRQALGFRKPGSTTLSTRVPSERAMHATGVSSFLVQYEMTA